MKYCIYLFLTCVTFSLYSQEEKSIQKAYLNYFELPRETLYTHLNKTTFIVGEEVWFKTYVHERHSNLPSKATTNINVGIYDDHGNLIENKLWLANNGGANGNILIDSTYTTGDYFIKASTNWMKNFQESDAFVQKIRIIAGDYDDIKPEVKTNTYDFQFLPEGGHLLTGINNTLGFKVIDTHGKGVYASGSIYDENNEEVATFKSNTFGIGKCLFKPSSGKNYTAKIELKNGYVFTKAIEDIKDYGINISVNNLLPEKVYINIQTNEQTLHTIKGKEYKLVLHKNGMMKSIPFLFESSTTKPFIISKSDLFKGINIFTVFDNNDKPLVERLIYNTNPIINKTKVIVNQTKSENDSLYFSIYTLNKNIPNENKALNNISISILPETSVAYDPDHNIISANELKPYLKGYVEKPGYYFADTTSKTTYDLDLLLLTQGWSRYNWNSVFNNVPEKRFEFENGVTLTGKVNFDVKINRLKLQEPELIGYRWFDIDVKNDNTFEVKNYFPLKDEIIRIAYIDKESELAKPKLYINCKLSPLDDLISKTDLIRNNSILLDTPLPEDVGSKDFFYDAEIELDEVLIKGKAKENRVESIGMQINNRTFKDNYTNITIKEATQFRTIADLIRADGKFNVTPTEFGGLRITTLARNTLNSNRSPAVFVDDVPISDFSFLTSINTADVEGILIDKNGFGLGMNGTNGVIRIYTRRTPLEEFNIEKSFAHISTANAGFTNPKTFYSPRYKSYQSKLFKEYGTIGWLPNVYLKHNVSGTFQLPNTNTDKINLYIEGYDSIGNFISQIVMLNINTSKSN
ncbi:hypothetical protein [Psychroserpens mesophilus]|uniref:hypothetical protein n=1 Tax=Psychroserpens mesophilus TaxID=325473 RepID=UPI003D658BBC